MVGVALPLSCLVIACSFSSTGSQEHENGVEGAATRYRQLVIEYEAMDDHGQATDQGRALRLQMSDLSRAIVESHLPKGSSQEQVLRLLGNPQVALDSTLLYYGDKVGMSHLLRFELGKLVSHSHAKTLDLEGGR